ncbi:MAG: UDP-N-acetylmuramoyl-L-alanine--D-glutamate ligase [Lachnospiraceae bacterium]|nr:UDP-N-acetylmuramoyl-L-alanine--D-glutamate ligase [Lachnospiraceae bacterium]
MDLRDKKVLVFGAGISGIGSASMLSKVGAKPVIYDGNAKLTPADVLGKLPQGVTAEVQIGELTKEMLADVELAVLSPGVPTDLPSVNLIREQGIKIWGELELAYENSCGDVLAITGTNGKTTTTTLLGEILKYHCEKQTAPVNDQVFVVGNIGKPYTETALLSTEATVSVAEVSSFQLETIDQFHPVVSAITNITPDHLNRHHTMEEYIRVKECITMNQTEEEVCVLNYEDEVLREFGKSCHCKAVFFSSARVLDDGYFYHEDAIWFAKDGQREKLFDCRQLKLPGLHNYENIMTAVAMARAYGVSQEEIRHVVLSFTAVEHRIEYVAEKKGVVYYNDSKGTNPDAAIKGIQAMDRPTVLIGGGYDKNSSYEEWIRAFNGQVTWLVLIGQTREKIAETARLCGFENIVLADSFEEAFAICTRKARPGDAVLLSPACASWDMFPSYEVRGRVFKDMVKALED